MLKLEWCSVWNEIVWNIVRWRLSFSIFPPILFKIKDYIEQLTIQLHDVISGGTYRAVFIFIQLTTKTTLFRASSLGEENVRLACPASRETWRTLLRPLPLRPTSGTTPCGGWTADLWCSLSEVGGVPVRRGCGREWDVVQCSKEGMVRSAEVCNTVMRKGYDRECCVV